MQIRVELEYRFTDACGWLDKQILKGSMLDIYSKAAGIFNNEIVKWNNEWDAFSGLNDDEELNDEQLKIYNHFIKKKMQPLCEVINESSGKVCVRPTNDAWYDFYLRNDPSKSGTFFIKAV